MSQSFSRREFLQLSASAAAMLGLVGCESVKITPNAWRSPRKPRPIAQGAKIRVAQIGMNGKGQSDLLACADEDIVALCDVDWSLPNVKKLFDRFPNAKKYKDFRKMLLEMDDQIDAVVISTPDHMHFLPAYMAISMGKHVCVQKPLTQTVWEADQLLKLARRHGVCTQMGNQGHAGEGIRLVKEWVQADVLGPVREVHIWTNRPIWPQGMKEWPAAEPVPADLDWDLYLGRAQEHTFSKAIHPFKWRGYREFGAGALGDMGCHIMDASFWSLDLHTVDPISIEAETGGLTEVGFPEWSIVTYKFPARGSMPPVTIKWYDGGKMPPRPKDLEETRQLAKGGQLLIGDKATVYDGNDYCNSPRIIPETKFKAMKEQLPPKTIRRPDPLGEPQKEWLQAIRKGDPAWAGSNFEYSVPLTKMVVLGNLAVLTGQKIEWDGKALKCTNVAEANKYVRPNFRKGWKPGDMLA